MVEKETKVQSLIKFIQNLWIKTLELELDLYNSHISIMSSATSQTTSDSATPSFIQQI